MNRTYHQMEAVFAASPEHLQTVALDLDWRIRYAAAVAIGFKKDKSLLLLLQQMLDIEAKRPLYSQPKTEFIGVEGDTSLAEQITPFTVVFPYEVDADTQEAWKCRGRVKQAILFAIYEIGEAHRSMIEQIEHLVMDEQEDAPVRAAAVRALGRVGNSTSLACCEYAATIDEWCTRVEAIKAIGALKHE